MIRTRTRLRNAGLVGVTGLILALAPAAAAQEAYPISFDDMQGVMPSSSEPLFVGGQYMWGVGFWTPQDPVGDPAAEPPIAPVPVSVTYDWGDGTATTTVTSDSGDGSVWCDSSGGEYRCWAWVGHDYATQGVRTITVSAHQDGALDGSISGPVVMYDLATGGTVRGSGTLLARFGGMYDQGFTEGTLTFQLNAKRRAGTSATNVSLVLSVPSMTPDNSDATGMTFTAKAATLPLYVQQLSRTSYEVLLDRVFGTVTNTGGSAGTAQAMLHAVVTKGQPTQLRFSVWNTSAGFTYVDTSGPEVWDRFSLTEENELLTGSLKVG